MIDKIHCASWLYTLGYKGSIDDAFAVQEFLYELLTSRIEHTRWFDYSVLRLRISEWASGAMTWNNLAYDLRQLISTDNAYKARINLS